MTTKQATAYLDGVHRHFSEKGIALTDPGDLCDLHGVTFGKVGT